MQPWVPLAKVKVLCFQSRLLTGLNLYQAAPGCVVPLQKKRGKLCQRPIWICYCSPNKLIQRYHFCCLIKRKNIHLGMNYDVACLGQAHPQRWQIFQITFCSTSMLARRTRINEKLAKSKFGNFFLQLNEEHRKSSTLLIVVDRRSVIIRTKNGYENPVCNNRRELAFSPGNRG